MSRRVHPRTVFRILTEKGHQPAEFLKVTLRRPGFTAKGVRDGYSVVVEHHLLPVRPGGEEVSGRAGEIREQLRQYERTLMLADYDVTLHEESYPRLTVTLPDEDETQRRPPRKPPRYSHGIRIR